MENEKYTLEDRRSAVFDYLRKIMSEGAAQNKTEAAEGTTPQSPKPATQEPQSIIPTAQHILPQTKILPTINLPTDVNTMRFNQIFFM